MSKCPSQAEDYSAAGIDLIAELLLSVLLGVDPEQELLDLTGIPYVIFLRNHLTVFHSNGTHWFQGMIQLLNSSCVGLSSVSLTSAILLTLLQ